MFDELFTAFGRKVEIKNHTTEEIIYIKALVRDDRNNALFRILNTNLEKSETFIIRPKDESLIHAGDSILSIEDRILKDPYIIRDVVGIAFIDGEFNLYEMRIW